MAEDSSDITKGESGTKTSTKESPTHSTSTGGGSGAASSGGGGSWWGSWIDTAKNKSASVLEAVKKDLDELTTVVKTEATNASSAIAETLNFQEPDSTANTVKKSLSSFFGQVSEALSPTLGEDDESEVIVITKDGAATLTGFHKHLAELQANDSIYLVEPADELLEKYERWMEVVDQDQFTQHRLEKQLASSDILQERYNRLVFRQQLVTHMQFWQRYLFKRALLEDALANADLAERRAKQEAKSAKAVTSPLKKIIQTEQPKRVVAEEDVEGVEGQKKEEGTGLVIAGEEVGTTPVEGGQASEAEALASIDEELSKLAENDLKWNADFSCDVELSEEEQARLLAEYEQEIQERERKTSTATATTAGAQKVGKKEEQSGKGGKGQQKNQQGKNKGGNQNQQQQQKGGQKGGAKGQKKTATAKDDSDESWEKDFDVE